MGRTQAALARALGLALLFVLAPSPAASATVTPQGSLAGVSIEPCGTPGTPTTTVFLPNITKTLGGPSGWVTPFIVQNVGAQTTTLEVSFFRFSDGALVVCRKVTGLAPWTSFADVPNNDVDLPGDTQFSVVVRSYGAQVVSVVNEHQGLGTPARAEALSYVGLTAGANTVYLPFVGKPEPAPCTAVPQTELTCNLRWLTTFVMQNFGTADATVTARFMSYDGGASVTLSRVIAPGRSRFIDPSVEAQLTKGRYYAVTLSSTQPIGVIANAHDDAPGTPAPRAFSYNGVPQPSVGETFLPYVRREGGPARLVPGGVLVQNAGPIDATPTLTFRRLGGGGAVSIAAPAPVKPGAAWYFDPEVFAVAGGYQLCAAAGPGKCIDAGEHSLVVTGGAFATLAATLAPGAAMGSTGLAAQGNRAYLPNVTRTLGGANGWSTPIVLQSSGATSATLRWYRFADGALVLRQPVGALTRGASVRVDPRNVLGLSDDTQYAVVVDAQGGNLAAIVTELNFQGGDGTMIYEGFAATVSTVPAPFAIGIAPASVRLSTGISAQLAATVKDQFDNVMPNPVVTWTVTPPTLGSVSATGFFTAGQTGGTGVIAAMAGTATANIPLTVVPPIPQTVGGINFLLRTTQTSEVYTETTMTTADAVTVATQVDFDVARIQQDYGRTFVTRPLVYTMASNASYTKAQSTILGVPTTATDQIAPSPVESAGLYYQEKIALDWSQLSDAKPLTAPRHELTHMMIDQIAGRFTDVPAWLNEGSARLEEFTVPGSAWRETVNKHSAVSMAANGQLFTLAQLTSQAIWNSRPGLQGTYQYYEASQAAAFVQSDVGIAGVTAILTLMSAGRSYEEAYAVVTGKTAESFAAALPSRLAGIAPAPGIAFAKDTPAGAGGHGPTYVVYGYGPGTSLRVDIRGASTGFTNTVKTYVADAYGVHWSYLTAAWPPDTYTFTITVGASTVTRTYTKAP